MENMLLSIIIPIYNAENFINKILDSILIRNFKDYEIILINDGSTDKSGIICDKYAKIDDRIVVLHKENGGVSSARNKGLDIAKGDYIAFVDPDDYIEPNMYKEMIQIAVSKEIDIVSCNYKKIDLNGKIEFKKSGDNLVIRSI